MLRPGDVIQLTRRTMDGTVTAGHATVIEYDRSLLRYWTEGDGEAVISIAKVEFIRWIERPTKPTKPEHVREVKKLHPVVVRIVSEMESAGGPALELVMEREQYGGYRDLLRKLPPSHVQNLIADYTSREIPGELKRWWRVMYQTEPYDAIPGKG